MDIFIHYGTDEFDKNHRYGKWKNSLFKPSGLWACNVLQKDNWLSWCLNERFEHTDFSKYIKFTLEDTAKILVVTKTEDIVPFVIMNKQIEKAYKEKGIKALSSTLDSSLNEIKLKKQYDGMMLVHGEGFYELHTNPGLFNGWDVDSIVVWNLDKVNVISTSKNSYNKRRIRVCA